MIEVQTRLVNSGSVICNALSECTTEAQVNLAIAGKQINIDQAEMTEAQLRGLHQYVRAMDLGTDTSSVETAISAII